MFEICYISYLNNMILFPHSGYCTMKFSPSPLNFAVLFRYTNTHTHTHAHTHTQEGKSKSNGFFNFTLRMMVTLLAFIPLV